jgi:hypothetical protein
MVADVNERQWSSDADGSWDNIIVRELTVECQLMPKAAVSK